MVCAFAGAAGLATPAAADDAVAFATVDGVTISRQQLEAALAGAIAQRFYHRRPHEEQVSALRREVSEGLVNRVLLVAEARRRGIEPNRDKVSAELAAYRRRVRDDAEWDRVRADVESALEERSVVSQLEAIARETREPAAAELEDHHKQHAEVFTEPEQLRLSVILLKVDPASPREAWQAAHSRAGELAQSLAGGADFAEVARASSQDATAPQGGDVGYLHRGMLAPSVEQMLDTLEAGAVSDPIEVLEGVAIFRLAERRRARVKPLAEVRERVADLWRREEGERRWQALIAGLRAQSVISIARSEGAPAAAGDAAGR